MRQGKTILLGLAVGALLLAAAVAVHAGGRGGCPGHAGTPSDACPGPGSAGALKDAKFEVSNLDDGVVIRITSDKSDVVKVIQAWFAGFRSGQGPCGLVRGSEACRKAHESGSCQLECSSRCLGHQTDQP